MSDERHTESLIEQTVSAHRRADPHGRLQPSPAYYDLPEAEREAAFDAALEARTLEAAIDPEGLSSTVRAVLGRIRAGG